MYIEHDTVMPIYCFVQKDFFKTWSNAMSYTLGFLFADGAITHTKRHTSYIAFHTTDRDILVAMASSMRATQKISRRSERSGLVYRLQIGSRDMVADLAKEKNCARLGFGKQDSLKLYEIMYNTGARDMIHLKRKKRVFEAFMQKMRT